MKMKKRSKRLAFVLSVTLLLSQISVPVMASEVEIVPDIESEIVNETDIQKENETPEIAEETVEEVDEAIVEEIDERRETESSGKCGDNLSYTFDASTGILRISGTGLMYDYDYMNYRMPAWSESTVKTVIIESGVEYIGDYAFYNCFNLTSIELPDGLTSIGTRAFSNCGMSSIHLPDTLTSIGYGAFASCSYLSSIILPIRTTDLGDYAFYNCSNLKSIELSEKTTSIGDSTFYGCKNLSSIQLPKGLTSIGQEAFYNCASLSSIQLPKGLISIGTYAFYNCDSLSSIQLPKGVTSIGESTFYDCDSLSSIQFSKGLVSIGTSAFYSCRLSSIQLPEGLTDIGDSAFRECSTLNSIEFPEGLTSIGSNAFTWCSSLIRIELPEGLSSIGNGAFSFCENLNTIALPDSLQIIGEEAFANTNSLSTIIIPEGSLDKLKNLVSQYDTDITEKNGEFFNSNDSLITILEVRSLSECTIASIGTKTYTGSALKPELVIKDNNNLLKENEDYTVRYMNNKAPGLAAVEITGIGKYRGTMKKSFYIRPKAATISSISNAAAGMTVKWKKISYADGYYVYRGSSKINTITSGDTLSYVDKAANTNGAKYTYKVYAYTKASDGKIVKSDASSSKSCYRLERPAISSLTNSATGKMLVKWGKNKKASGYQVQYSQNKNFSSVKTVTVSGYKNNSRTIKGLTKGEKYYVRVRSYKTVSRVKYYSVFSGTKYVKITA